MLDEPLYEEAKKNLRHAAHLYVAVHGSSSLSESAGERRTGAEAELYLAALALAHMVFRPRQAKRLIARERARRASVRR